ncbi:hypothetical protein KFK09_016120 [Dendrobium nobile]|uniref:Uncharacterized protein n=1 Tax=Dendrobium nobile TaxID=94219 RepID=A0A8T3AYG6_DENNO|nr:hypothetical protein KFK09_016120 [Dendrobium nobile]
MNENPIYLSPHGKQNDSDFLAKFRAVLSICNVKLFTVTKLLFIMFLIVVL